MASTTPFGRPLREQHFFFEKDYVPLNHGSFGAFPRSVHERMLELSAQCESRPDTYIRYEFPPLREQSRSIIAGLLKADPTAIVFVPNATTAVNVVLRSLVWEKGDVILTCEIIYSGFDKTIEYIVESTAAETEDVGLQWPIEDDDLVSGFEAKIKQIQSSGRRARLAVFDTVSSMPGVRVPFEKLVQKCRDLGVMSFLDGAQGIGHIPIDLGQIKPDFFCTNLHKWFYTPRGSAILYVAEHHQHLIRSSIPTSHGFKPLPRAGQRVINNPFPPVISSAFQELFSFVGTDNTDAYITVPAALEFREKVCGGEEKIMNYCIELAKEGGDRAAQVFGTEVLDNKAKTLRNCALANVRLPLEYGNGEGKIPIRDYGKVAQFIAEESVKLKTFFPIIFIHGAHWWRISAQAYLEMADIEWGIQAMNELCEIVKRGEHQSSPSH